MEQYELTSEGYIQIKQKIKDKLNETVNSFIAIGYYLKQVRDSGAYTQDGYSSINDFAKGEYGLDASTTSRFMAMNTAYSEGGNSLAIKQQYKAIAEARSGRSLLEEMLTMSDEDRELVTEDTTVRQVRELKALEREEKEAEKAQAEAELPLVEQGGLEPPKSTIEHNVRLAAVDDEDEADLDALTATLRAFLKENIEIYQRVKAGILTPELFAEAACPSGARTYKHKVNMLFLYTYQGGVRFRRYEGGKPTIESHSYNELFEMAQGIEIKTVEVVESVAEAVENDVAVSQDEAEVTEPAEVEEEAEDADDREDAVIVEEKTEFAYEVEKSIYTETIGEAEERALRLRRYLTKDVDAARSFFMEELKRMERSGVENTAKFQHYQMAYDAITKWFCD